MLIALAGCNVVRIDSRDCTPETNVGVGVVKIEQCGHQKTEAQ